MGQVGRRENCELGTSCKLAPAGGNPDSKKSVIICTKGFSDSTVAHETLHSMGLYHTFDNDSKFTFKFSETDNIMDYSDIENRKIPVISTFVWQWKRLWKILK